MATGAGRRARCGQPDSGIRPVRTISPTSLSWCEEVGDEVVTLWLLSTDNLSRPERELSPLLRIIEVAVDLRAGCWRINSPGPCTCCRATPPLPRRRCGR